MSTPHLNNQVERLKMSVRAGNHLDHREVEVHDAEVRFATATASSIGSISVTPRSSAVSCATMPPNPSPPTKR